MKPLFNVVVQFFQKEWFLLVLLCAIMLIVLLFEMF